MPIFSLVTVPSFTIHRLCLLDSLRRAHRPGSKLSCLLFSSGTQRSLAHRRFVLYPKCFAPIWPRKPLLILTTRWNSEVVYVRVLLHCYRGYVSDAIGMVLFRYLCSRLCFWLRTCYSCVRAVSGIISQSGTPSTLAFFGVSFLFSFTYLCYVFFSNFIAVLSLFS